MKEFSFVSLSSSCCCIPKAKDNIIVLRGTMLVYLFRLDNFLTCLVYKVMQYCHSIFLIIFSVFLCLLHVWFCVHVSLCKLSREYVGKCTSKRSFRFFLEMVILFHVFSFMHCLCTNYNTL